MSATIPEDVQAAYVAIFREPFPKTTSQIIVFLEELRETAHQSASAHESALMAGGAELPWLRWHTDAHRKVAEHRHHRAVASATDEAYALCIRLLRTTEAT